MVATYHFTPQKLEKMITENTCIQYWHADNLTPNSFGLVNSHSENELQILKYLIKEEGILEPLVVTPDGTVVSGNRRLRAALDLGLKEVPVMVINPIENDIEKMVIHYNQRREKKEIERYLEWERIKKIYGIGRGFRVDKNPAVKELKDNTIGYLSKSQFESFQKLFRLIEELGLKEEDYIEKLMKGETVNSLIKRLNLVKSVNRIAEKKRGFDYVSDKIALYNSSSFGAPNLTDNSLDCIVCSPPYFKYRDYGNGNNDKLELGQEEDFRDFVENLTNHFKSIIPKMKMNGKIWVNLMDTIYQGRYLNVVENFICRMSDLGFFVLDKWIWVKNNPTPMGNEGANINHEHVICFGLHPFHSFNEIKAEGICQEQRDCLTYNNGSKLKTAFSFPEKVIRSNTNDFNELKEKCEERGIPFTHTAGFPVELPELLIKLSTEPGDLVVDLFSGTGTTGQAALSLKRRYVGYELNPAYHEIAQIRLEDYTEQYVFTFFNEDEEEMGEFLLVA